MDVKVAHEEHGPFFLLLSVRNKDMSWPEEMSFIANSSKMDRHKGELQQNWPYQGHRLLVMGCTRLHGLFVIGETLDFLSTITTKVKVMVI